MDEMLSYICSRLRTVDVDFRSINKTLKTQTTLNVIFASTIWVAVLHIKKQQEEIKELTEAVLELKKEKGE